MKSNSTSNKLKAKGYIHSGDMWYSLDGAERDETCAICMTEFEESDDTVTACKNKHRFHRSCISDWTAMGSHKKCPICRSKIVIKTYGEIEVDESVDSLRDVAWDGEKFIAVGHGRTLYGTSITGIDNWNIISEFSEETSIFEGGGGDAICMNNQKILIGGYVTYEEQSPIIYSNRNIEMAAYTETDKPSNISKISGLCWGGSCWGDGKFIAVGYNTENIQSGRTVIYSYDGEVWENTNNIFGAYRLGN
jgi:DNA-directed RNA polymerase subunit RPC12/RpoP